MPSLGIAPHPEGCTGPFTMPAPGVTSASGAMPTDVTFRRLEIGVQAVQLSPYHTGPADASVPAPGPDRCFSGMRLSRSPHGSGLAIGPRNLPSSSSRLRRGYDKAPRGAIPVIVQEAFSTRLALEARLRRARVADLLATSGQDCSRSEHCSFTAPRDWSGPDSNTRCRGLFRRARDQPIEPSICSASRRFSSTAYSIGNSLVNASKKPLTIIVLASVSVRPRLCK